MFTIPKDSPITGDIIENAISYNEELRDDYDRLEDYYIGKHDILKRKKKGTKINNKVVVNHAKYITDINTGYLLGNPVQYQVVANKEDGTPLYNITPVMDMFRKHTVADLDHEIAKDVSIYGVQYEYVFATEDNEIKSKAIDNRNCVLIYDDTMEHELVYGILYDFVEDKGATNKRKYTNVLVLSETKITQWAGDDGKLSMGEEKDHFFGEVPIIEYRNNAEKLGDFESVLTLIDAYNTVQSDRVNDRQQLVDTILLLYNFDMTPEQVTSMKEERVLTGIPDGADAKYLEKGASDAEIDVLRKVIEADIHKISMTPNLSDENFVGNSSGVAIKYKILAFDQNILNKERYFERGLLKRFKLYNTYLKILKKMDEVPTYEIDVVFKRNLPKNDYETSQMINNLDGYVPKEMLIAQLSFVKDAKEAVKAVEQEKLEDANVESENFGTDEPNPPVDNEETV